MNPHRFAAPGDLEEEVAEELAAMSPLTVEESVAAMKTAVTARIKQHVDRDTEDWATIADDTFYAVARKDGAATVVANTGGFWLSRTTGDPELQDSAEAALDNAAGIPAVKA